MDAKSLPKDTREQWLYRLVAHARPMFKEAGSPLPKNVRVAVGLPFGTRKAIGQCFHTSCSEDKGREIWVSPVLGGDPLAITGTLVHELCHAALPDGTGHGKDFSTLGRAMLLTGKPTEMGHGGDEFAAVWTPILKEIGRYPGKVFSPGAGKKTKKTYMIKLACEPCGAIWRMTAGHADRVTACPCCGSDELVVG